MRLLNFFVFFLFVSWISVHAQVSVQGTITQAGSSDPLIGVTIIEKGQPNGTLTGSDGRYQITVGSEDAILVFSYLGFTTQEIAINGQQEISLALQEDIANLDEVVIVGYGVQKKAVVTGAISKVRGEDLEDMPVTRIEQSLLGRTSGVRVTTASGQPGEGATVRIRGTSSINASEPLYVVDGVPIGGGIDFLNQGDIESIEVLKDAASASIYGARSAGGVILVTTKQGKKDRMEVNYSGYYGTQAPWKKLALLDAREYGILMNESSVAAGGSILFEDPESLGVGTDWQDAVFNYDAPIQNHELSITAGSEKSSYYASFGYFDQSGIVSDAQSRYQRFTARFNSTHKINKRITFGNTLAYSRIKGVGVSTNSEFGSPLSRAINLDPITPLLETDPAVLGNNVFSNFPVVTNDEGVPYGISTLVTSEVLNPVAALRIQQGYGWSDKVVGNAFGEIEFIDGLKFRSSIGTDLAFWGNEGFTPIYYLNATNRSDLTRYNRAQNRGLYWIWQNTLSYTRSFGNHNLSLLAGTVAERNAGEGIGGGIQDLPVNHIDEASLSFPTPAETQTYYGFEYQGTLASYLSRINYNYAEKYLLSATMRVDGSSKFGSNNKFGYFPSISVGWVVTQENFLRENPLINFFKIRGSWGVNGNDQIGDFRFVSTVGGGRNYTFGLDDRLVNGVSPNAIANPDLRWEETKQSNLGFDAKIFKRVSVTFDLFEKKTTDMLLDIAVPGYVGNAGPVGNIATMENRGWELELGYGNTVSGFQFEFNGNLSYVQNTVTDLGPDKEFLPGQRFSPQGLEITRTTVGLPIGYFYGYKTDGIFQTAEEVATYTNADGNPLQPEAQAGDFRFVDVNENGEIDPEDRTFIGDPTPNWTYGFNASVGWKGFDLVVFGQGVAGNELFKATRRFDLQMANMTGDALDRWTGEGTSTTYPRLVMNDPNRNFSRSSDFYVENGAFFRIKTLQLGYSIPKGLKQAIGFSKIRFYISGNNLLTFTEYSGFDPEIGGGSYGVDRGIYPQARFYLLGINATF
ncbi:MAG: TonB-dependent receptor [Bacteroidota bacterium]